LTKNNSAWDLKHADLEEGQDDDLLRKCHDLMIAEVKPQVSQKPALEPFHYENRKIIRPKSKHIRSDYEADYGCESCRIEHKRKHNEFRHFIVLGHHVVEAHAFACPIALSQYQTKIKNEEDKIARQELLEVDFKERPQISFGLTPSCNSSKLELHTGCKKYSFNKRLNRISVCNCVECLHKHLPHRPDLSVYEEALLLFSNKRIRRNKLTSIAARNGFERGLHLNGST
jgi:hypothetical protein